VRRLLSVCMRRWVFLDLFACAALVSFVGLRRWAFLDPDSWPFLDPDSWPFLDLLVVY
jgi:hypothetical protein